MCKELEKKEATYLEKKRKGKEILNKVKGSLKTQEIYFKIMGFTEEDFYSASHKDYAKNKFT